MALPFRRGVGSSSTSEGSTKHGRLRGVDVDPAPPDEVRFPQPEAPEVEAEEPEPRQVELAADLSTTDRPLAGATSESLAEDHGDFGRDTRRQLAITDLSANIRGEADTCLPLSDSPYHGGGE